LYHQAARRLQVVSGAEGEMVASNIRRQLPDHLLHDHFRHAIKWYASLDQRLLQWSDMLPLPGGSAQDRRSHQITVGVTAADRRMRFMVFE
jgi:hypothetical protein